MKCEKLTREREGEEEKIKYTGMYMLVFFFLSRKSRHIRYMGRANGACERFSYGELPPLSPIVEIPIH